MQRHAHPRLADAGLAADQYNAAFAGFRPLPLASQQLDLFVAPDERCGLRAQCLEAAQDATFADNAPGTLRVRQNRREAAARDPRVRTGSRSADVCSRQRRACPAWPAPAAGGQVKFRSASCSSTPNATTAGAQWE